MPAKLRRGKGQRQSGRLSELWKSSENEDAQTTPSAAGVGTRRLNLGDKADNSLIQTEPQRAHRRQSTGEGVFESLSFTDETEIIEEDRSTDLLTGPPPFDIIVDHKSNAPKNPQASPADTPLPSIEKEDPKHNRSQQRHEVSSDEESRTSKMSNLAKSKSQKRNWEDDPRSKFSSYHKRHFFYHDEKPQHLALAFLQKERLECYYCQIQKFTINANYPIAITNTTDQQVLPRNFKFIESSILREGVKAADAEFHTGCECKNDEDCKFIGCHCLQDIIPSATEKDGKVLSYHGEGSNAECLRNSKLASRDPIYECQAACSCGKTCSNRVVERGRKVPLNIFRTDDYRGWGVKCKVNIKKGQFIDKYIGEIITAEEANRRRKASSKSQSKDVYLFALDKFSDPNSLDPRLAGPAYEVDGEFCAGPTRFINHSCDPNVRIFARVGDHADKHIHDLAFFAIEDIPAQTELTFDYVDGEVDLIKDSQDPKTRGQMTRCLCKSKNCRGFLW